MDTRKRGPVWIGTQLMVLGSLTLPMFAQAQTGPGYGATGAYPPGQYYRSGGQFAPVPGPYGEESERGPAGYGMRSGQDPGSYGMSSPWSRPGQRGGPGMMGGPQTGPGQMAGPGMMGGPQAGPGQMAGPGMMGGPQTGPGRMAGPGMMGGPQAGPGQMGGPGMMGGPQAGPGQRGGPGMMGGPQAGPGQMGGKSTMMGIPQGGPEGEPAETSTAAAGGPAMAMLDAVGRLDLTSEQRTKLNAIRADLNRRQQELLEKIATTTAKLQKVSREQMLTSQSLGDFKGHLMFANMDAANRAEEMLTKEQRQILVNGAFHVRTPEMAR